MLLRHKLLGRLGKGQGVHMPEDRGHQQQHCMLKFRQLSQGKKKKKPAASIMPHEKRVIAPQARKFLRIRLVAEVQRWWPRLLVEPHMAVAGSNWQWQTLLSLNGEQQGTL